MQTVLIITGAIILILNFADFFHTTLSGNGFGKISAAVNKGLSVLVLKNKSKTLFKYSGLVHVLATTVVWLLLLLTGIYFINLSGPEMVVNAQTGLPASYLDRFYFMCYVVSTLGNGDFIPGNNLNRIFTGIFSFSGFILLTTALTYFLSVVKAVLQKKQLALYISSMGTDVKQLYNYLSVEDNSQLLKENAHQIRKMIIVASSAYIFFPVVQYFLIDEKRASTELQLARLHEVLLVLQNEFPKSSDNYKRIHGLRKSISYYLDLGLEDQEDYERKPLKIASERQLWKKWGRTCSPHSEMDHSLHAALQGAGWDWEDVYEAEEQTL
ncbi:potassium channel family protein [Aequorivita ciconiae]|nr:potassium channel family protein [Aequorivita sp. H23M31]